MGIKMMGYDHLEEYCKQKHAGQKYGNQDYFYHLKAVADQALNLDLLLECEIDQDLLFASYLHDILEDTNTTADELREFFKEQVVTAVILLTKVKDENYSYYEYITRIKSNTLARKVKIADTICNLRASIESNEKSRILKYSKQLCLLTK